MKIVTWQEYEKPNFGIHENYKCDCCGKEFRTEFGMRHNQIIIGLKDKKNAMVFTFCSEKCLIKQMPILKEKEENYLKNKNQEVF